MEQLLEEELERDETAHIVEGVDLRKGKGS